MTDELMTPREITDVLWTVLLDHMTTVLHAQGVTSGELKTVDLGKVQDFMFRKQLHLPTVVGIFRELGYTIDMNLSGRPYVTLQTIEPADGKKLYRVSLSGLARMKQTQEVRAHREEEAVEAAFLLTGDNTWKYDEMVDDTIEGHAHVID